MTESTITNTDSPQEVPERPYPKKYTFEDVWAALMEDREQLRKQKEENDKRKEETDRYMRRLNKQMGDLHNRFGEIAEHLVAPNIYKRFNELGYHFGSYTHGVHKIFDESGKIRAEFDILLENGEYIIAVEVKTKPTEKDIQRHIERLGILREHRNKINDHRIIQGAIAGAIFPKDIKEKSIEAGFFVIEQSGDTMKIEIPEGFIPREW